MRHLRQLRVAHAGLRGSGSQRSDSVLVAGRRSLIHRNSNLNIDVAVAIGGRATTFAVRFHEQEV